MQFASALLSCLSSWLLDRNQFNFEDKRCIRWDDASRASTAVAEIRWDRRLPLSPWAHSKDHQVKTLDDLASAETELESAVAVVAAIELLPVRESPSVMHFNSVAIFGFGPFARSKFFNRDHLLSAGRSLTISISK